MLADIRNDGYINLKKALATACCTSTPKGTTFNISVLEPRTENGMVNNHAPVPGIRDSRIV